MPTHNDPTSKNEQRRQQILPLAARPQGMRAHDVQGMDYKGITQEIARLCKRGVLVRVRVSHRNARFFMTKEQAQRWMRANGITCEAPPKRKPRPPSDPTIVIKRHSGAHWQPGQEAVITSKTKVTIAPRPRDRFEVEPGFERVISADWRSRRLAEVCT